MKIAIFIDYDNLMSNHKMSGILDISTTTLLRTAPFVFEDRSHCDIRVYGGWFEEAAMTSLAQKLSVDMQREFPAIIRLPDERTGKISLTATAELAVAMMEEPGHHLFNTYRKKGTVHNLRVHKPETVGCTDPACPLPVAKKLLKTGSCPMSACMVSDELVYRHEQKIVDTMLTCDMVYVSGLEYDLVILVSGDDDFLPPLRTLLLRGAQVARFHPRPNRFAKPIILAGKRLIDLDL